jgi:hypothetical protein
MAVCVPARPLTWRPAVREAAPSYGTLTEEQVLLPRRDVEALSRGHIDSSLELDVGPEEVFSQGQARLELLAQNILLQTTLKPYRRALSVALAAPAEPSLARLDALQHELRQLLKKAEQSLSSGASGQPEALEALQRLASLATAKNSQEFLARASEVYNQPPQSAEDIYVARALIERPQEALELLGMRRFLARAVVPPSEPDLDFERTRLEKQIAFAQLVPQPHLFSSPAATFAQFRSRYRIAYLLHHDRYWQETLTIYARLLEIAPQVEALRRLNTLTELGPPLAEGAAAAFSQLLDESAGCPLTDRLEEELDDNAVCPSCGLSMDQEPPRQSFAEVLDRLQRGLRRQMARLSSTAVQQVLARSGDARVEQFLKVVQASQLVSLPELLDDSLLGFLRRFLVEARIQAVLQPIINRLEKGPPPREEEAEQVMHEVSRVLQRAFRAARRALPPPPDTDVPAPM